MIERETADILTPWSTSTVTHDILTSIKGKEWRNKINEILLKEWVEPDSHNVLQKVITQHKELLREIVSMYRICEARPPINKIEFTNEEREENLRFYNRFKSELYKKYTGKYVVIAKGDVQAVGESFDNVKDVALDTNHRFIFKVEPKKKVRGVLRWPMKKK